MLELALKAGIPIISVETTDTLNVLDVLRHISGETVTFVERPAPDWLSSREETVIVAGELAQPYEKYYRNALETFKVIILLNTDIESPLIYKAGVLPTPPNMVDALLSEILEDAEVEEMALVLGGLTLKDISEVCRLTMARDGDLTSTGVMETRRMYTNQMKGIMQVDTGMDYYYPDDDFEAWIHLNRKFFLRSEDARLIPRGILLDGEPGVGKTMGAKRMAEVFGVPLYRIDLSSMMTKWLGESEGRLASALQQIDREEPCVLLLDEVEKLFANTGDDSGVTTRLLSQLLWWLQEHKSRVFTVMTTNSLENLPPELYRPGRIDETYVMKGLRKGAAILMVENLLDSFDLDDHWDNWFEAMWAEAPKNNEAIGELSDGTYRVAHATVTQWVFKYVKNII